MNEKTIGEIILYQPDDTIKLEVKIENETVWLTQAQMVVLFDRDQSVISKHIRNIFKDEELDKMSVYANFAYTATDGKVYRVEYYNLDVIISVGYRVKSKRGTKFRQWATRVLKEYMLKGFVVDKRIERIEHFAIDTAMRVTEIEKKIDFLNQYVEDVLADKNDINEDTRIQLELINEMLAELQAKNKTLDKPRNPIGFKITKV